MNKKYRGDTRKRRTDKQWVDELSGRCGAASQTKAVDELTRYLFVVVYNDLIVRQGHIVRLGELAHDELCQFAQDFSQQFMEKLVKDEFALLEKFHAKGHFTTWASQVVLNLVRSEFRRARWSTDVAFPFQITDPQSTMLPDLAVINAQMFESLQRGVEQLPTQMHNVFIRLVLKEEKASALAEEMGVTVNTIYLIMHRAKKKIRRFMQDDGYQLQDFAF